MTRDASDNSDFIRGHKGQFFHVPGLRVPIHLLIRIIFTFPSYYQHANNYGLFFSVFCPQSYLIKSKSLTLSVFAFLIIKDTTLQHIYLPRLFGKDQSQYLTISTHFRYKKISTKKWREFSSHNIGWWKSQNNHSHVPIPKPILWFSTLGKSILKSSNIIWEKWWESPDQRGQALNNLVSRALPNATSFSGWTFRIFSVFCFLSS